MLFSFQFFTNGTIGSMSVGFLPFLVGFLICSSIESGTPANFHTKL
jgi:hypothetical protein